jgi:peptidoglycan/LPS O-acetylase OafA/YrhL
MKRYDQLTFSRFWAILLVFIYHGGASFYISPIAKFPLTPILYSAPSAVAYLYVLSGFVMSLVYFRPKIKFDILSYWSARFVRIYPLYIFSFLLIAYYYIDGMARIKPQKTLANIFVLQAWWPPYAQSFNYSTWSITVEFFFYAVFPFFIIWAYRQSTRKLIWASVILWTISQTIHYILWIGFFPAWEMFIVYFPFFHLNSFIIGVVGGIWFVREAKDREVNQRTNLFVIFGSLALIAGYLILSAVYPQLPHDLQPMAGLLSPFFVVFIVALALDKTKLSTVLSHRWLVVLGETAFALYILHVPVIWLYERALFSSGLPNAQIIFEITYLPLMIAVGLIAYYFIDPPIRNWLKNILKRVSMPLLLLDLAIVTVSIFISFRLRFGDGREYLSYRSTGLLMFWSAFFFRTFFSVALNAVNPKILYLPLGQMLRPLLMSVSAGSVVVTVIIFAGYSAGWFENFPRSIFLFDWLIILSLSLLVRFIFRGLGWYKQEALPA